MDKKIKMKPKEEYKMTVKIVGVHKGEPHIPYSQVITPTLYTISSLEWEGDDRHSVYANIAVGRYRLSYNGYSKKPWVLEYVDMTAQALGDYKKLEDGKVQAEKHYREQLEKCLEVYDG